MKKITTLLLAVLITSVTQAQVVYGVRTGFGLTYAEQKIDRKTDDNRAGILGFNIGVFGEKNLFNDFVYGQLGISLSTQGWENTNSKTTTHLNYLQVNPSLKIEPPYWSHFYAQSGPYLGCAINGKNNGQKIKFGREADGMKASDFGVAFELGWQYDNILLGLGLQQGITNFSNVKNSTDRNRNLMLNATYLFENHLSHSKKKYTNQTDTIRFRKSNKREILFLHISYSPINFHRMVTENGGAKISTGIFGGSIGLDYHHSKKQFVHLGVALGSNFILPLPVFSTSGEPTGCSSVVVSNNHKIGKFTIGYGFTYTDYFWQKGFAFISTITEDYSALGLVIPTYFLITEFFNAGIVYKPTFYRPNMTNKFSYEHAVSIDFAFKIRLI